MELEPAGLPLEVDVIEADGRRRSLETLYAEHAPAALRLAYLLTGERELAEDLVHDAFVRLLARWGELRRPDAVEAYLRRTIVNLSHSTFRRRRLERAHLQREKERAATTASWSPDLEERDELWHRLRQVAPRQRAALVLRYYADLSESQTADLLGCSVRTVNSLVSRGLETLRHQTGGQS